MVKDLGIFEKAPCFLLVDTVSCYWIISLLGSCVLGRS